MITPVILAGGAGTRLWPLSRKSFPKQFSVFEGVQSLFQQTVARLSGAGMTRPLVLTSEDFRFIVTEQLGKVGILPEHIFIEPEGRDTAPAILLAAMSVSDANENGLMLVAPSDHLVPNTDAFLAAVAQATPDAQAGQIVTFGITPDRPETGYGYLELSGDPVGGQTAPLARFVEKPDRATAEEMLATGRYLWNAGIFLMKASTVLAAFEKYAPQLVDPVRAALDGAQPDLGFKRLDAVAWSGADKISVDYAIMEKADNLVVMPFPDGWTDLGDWEAVRWTGADTNGVRVNGDATALECEDSLLWSEGEGQKLIGLGLKDVIAVAMPDAVLVADRSRSQDVKKVVDALRAKGAAQADAFTRDHRPWGWFESLAMGPRFQVKRICVHPGGVLSLQSHVHRAEHWVVVEGSAQVTVGDTVKMVFENQSIYVPQGDIHRLENPGKVELTLIEVQTGSYLGEDDIIRHEDVYSRG
ncbi:mannose-1-phosphate guanylyltransferase/mannose-6-phosphate isomerase [Octadecabacter sp. G9-8]|uniref:mannose-1-phosphate guanylyltransferase n=1 Tax=Octadecabacter dasysiphoniae TaxID=2909341 RepID=A0ABS9CVS4_9RHOB|nr:mannose-1-phosphate guanylyltransferase/mannose-6-phosphate isomerase [Octadecabacter dasysiphoniae]MCF2871339.1 mannose-1-phosphate guanylyltransferase/mannose-6-phosphate isomerase [Octadecabacter dasysiphoniae]